MNRMNSSFHLLTPVQRFLPQREWIAGPPAGDQVDRINDSEDLGNLPAD
jgi:hypothetical protein